MCDDWCIENDMPLQKELADMEKRQKMVSVEELYKLREILSLYFDLIDMNYEITTRCYVTRYRYTDESLVNLIREYEETLECVEAALRKEVRK